jgi:hypothetical protein
MTKNATNTILMVRPIRFGMNAQTAVDNFYQQQDAATDAALDNAKAQAEFDAFVSKLRAAGVEVLVVQDDEQPHTPDSIFPNNWISMHEDGCVVLYPMKAENRRLERRADIEEVLTKAGFVIGEVLDISDAEEQGTFLEGTGCIIFDHDHKIAYMARSQRADEHLFEEICGRFDYQSVVFSAFQDTPEGRQPIYHTNVLMCMTDRYAVLCLDAIDDMVERTMVTDTIRKSGKEVIEISEAQKHQFGGNMLLVKGDGDALHLVMSTSAHKCLTNAQKAKIEGYHKILHSDLTTIETLGGGSARCMLAEIYLPKQP